MIKYFLKAFKHFADFNGRASPPEYWYFVCIMIGLYYGLIVLFGLTDVFIFIALAILVLLACFIPQASVAVRRMHDSGHSGWNVLVPLYNLYLLAKKGTDGPNKYGPDPYGNNDEKYLEASNIDLPL